MSESVELKVKPQKFLHSNLDDLFAVAKGFFYTSNNELMRFLVVRLVVMTVKRLWEDFMRFFVLNNECFTANVDCKWTNQKRQQKNN